MLKGRGEPHKLSVIAQVQKKKKLQDENLYEYMKEEFCTLTVDVLESLLGRSSLLGTL